MSHILIADDDIELSQMLREYLELDGFEVSVAYDGKSALEQALGTASSSISNPSTSDSKIGTPPDAMLLDIMMPKINGFDVLRALRKESNIPVLMLTARGDDIDSILGLELGADDYLGKPSNPRVISARLRALLRRSQPLPSNSDALTFDSLSIDSQNRIAHIDNDVLDLTSTEFSLLFALAANAGKALSKSELSEFALGRPLSAYDRSIDMHISHLRKKLGDHQQARIKTVRGIGYQFTIQIA